MATNTTPSQSTIDNNQRRAKALEKVVEHNRDYLKLDVTLPLGNTALKKVHTNQWLWTTLPKEFDLTNWVAIADALNSTTNRYEGYVRNKWYIDGCDISVDAKGKAEMKLSLNAFASTHSEYHNAAKSMQKAYTDATNKQTTNNTTSATKNTTNAVATKSLINESWVKKYNISSTIVNKVKSICKVGASDYYNVKLIFKWMDDHLPYEGYANTRYGATGTLNHGKGNCCDHAHLFAAMCRSIGVKCNYIHNSCIEHVYNKVYIDGKSYIVDTGRDLASWGSHWGGSGCPTEKTSIDF